MAIQHESDEALVKHLLTRTESNILDFKREQYKLTSGNQRSGFILDIVSMANTPRDEPAYIAIGINEEHGRVVEVIGVDSHIDPADFQNLVNGHTERAINFSYRVVLVDGVELGLFEIAVDKNVPIMARDNFHRFRAGTVHIRRNAQNAVADANEIGRIYEWRQSAPSHPANVVSAGHAWDIFYRACNQFEDGRIYVAVIGDGLSATGDYGQIFASVGWHMVVDFDRETDESGVFFHTKEHLEKRRSVRISALDEPVGILSRSTCLWVAANGLESRPTTSKGGTFREWNRRVSGPISAAMTNVARVTEPLPVTAIVISEIRDETRVICERLDEAFGDRLDFVFASDSIHEDEELIPQFEGHAVPISFPAICAGLRDLTSENNAVEVVDFPAYDGGFTTVEPGVARWLEEELELVHQNLGTTASDLHTELEQFLRTCLRSLK